MKPRLLNLAAGVSLLLAIAIVVLWVRSHDRHESLYRYWHTPNERGSEVIQLSYSSIGLTTTRIPDTSGTSAQSYAYMDWTDRESGPVRELRWFPLPPVRFWHFHSSLRSDDVNEVTVADWLLLLPTLPLPLIALVRHRRRRRRETNNLCPTCGYDLRATPEKSGPLFDRCPECGAVNAVANAAHAK